MNKDDLDNRFTYHAPKAGHAFTSDIVRATALVLAELVNEVAPEGREKSLAVTHIEEAVFWTNAAIARGK